MIRRRAPLKRSPLKRSSKPIPKKRAQPRRGPLRDPGYLDYLRTECKCVACAMLPQAERLQQWSESDPAHGPVNGRSSKGPDNEALPLCRWHHEEQGSLGHEKFTFRYGFIWKLLAATFYARYQEWKRQTGVTPQ